MVRPQTCEVSADGEEVKTREKHSHWSEGEDWQRPAGSQSQVQRVWPAPSVRVYWTQPGWSGSPWAER